MYIVQIASECAPVIKAGGLGDVYGLSRELQNSGHTVEIILGCDSDHASTEGPGLAQPGTV